MPTLRLESMAIAGLLAAPALAQNTGPSTTVAPYMLPTRAGVTTTSLLTVGDAVGGYRMVGIPDGLGAFDGGSNRLVLLMNHELGNGDGIARAGGFAGSFVSRWEIDRTSLAVVSGRDFNTAPADLHWSSQAARALSRFCGADLAAPSAYRFGALGTDARIYLNGEESGNEGTGWAHVAIGPTANQSWELPALGRFSWESSVGCPFPQDKTLVVGLDDSTPGQVYVYVGTKTQTGDDVTRAGLTNGTLYGVRVAGVANETRGTPLNGTFDLAPMGSQIGVTGAALDAASIAAGVTRFLRPEDGNWDPRPGHQHEFYFVTTDTLTASGGRSRLYRLTFANIASPELGGTITALLTGTEGAEMMDNMTVDSLGRVLLQEDVGGNARLGRIWLYDITSGSLGEVAIADSTRFLSGQPGFLTQDEEASGILDAKDLLGLGWFLMDLQAHYGIPGELVQGGQMLAMFIDPAITLPVGVDSVGASSPGCQGPLAISVQSPPRAGNAAFALTCLKAPASSGGVVLFGLSALQSPLPILGINLWVDPNSLLLAVAVTSDAQGRGPLPLPVPANAVPGGIFYTQFVWVGPNSPAPCPPQGVSASNAVKVTIQS